VKIIALRTEYIVREKYINETGCLNTIFYYVLRAAIFFWLGGVGITRFSDFAHRSVF
jgi:hypothetical protein